MVVQWWLSEPDRYGNAKLVDGPHSNREGVLQAISLHEKLYSGANSFARKIGNIPAYGWQIARVELELACGCQDHKHGCARREVEVRPHSEHPEGR